MNTIIFLIFWMPYADPQALPNARFIRSFETMKECTAMRDSVKDVEIKPHLSCLQIVVEPLKDAGGVI